MVDNEWVVGDGLKGHCGAGPVGVLFRQDFLAHTEISQLIDTTPPSKNLSFFPLPFSSHHTLPPNHARSDQHPPH